MCGIVGSNYFDIDPKILIHRGPDNVGKIEFEDIKLGHTRLSIIDLDAEANQPMEFDGVIIVFNGEIYNYKELIKEHNLKVVTKSDTEVLIRLYQKYDTYFLNYLNGMFSFCIYDKKKRKFFCARDRFGKKPFFYYYKDGKFLFASEIKVVLKSLDFLPNINFDALSEYLSFMAPINSHTFYEDIKKLQAGHFLILDRDLKIEKYYDIENRTIEYSDEKVVLEEIERILVESIELRLRSDVPIASFLSGGIDSSLVTALYAKVTGKKVDTFSVGFSEYKRYDELDFAKMASQHINSNHTEIIINRKDFIETIDAILQATDEPFGDSAIVPTYLLSKKVHQSGFKVAFSGEGSDELFLGYDNYFKIFEYYDKNCSLPPFNFTKEWEYIYRKVNYLPIYQSCGEVFTERQKEFLLRNYCRKFLLQGYMKNFEKERWVSYIDFKIWIAEVLMTKIDRASMASSLEVRAPFLDYRLVEFIFKVDNSLKKGNANKYLLKNIALKYLPQEIVLRRKKGFSSPYIEWLYDEYGKGILDIILKANKEINIFNEEFIHFLFKNHKIFKQELWLLYIFSKWFLNRFL